MPVILDLVQVILDLLLHGRLLVREALELGLHDAHVVLEEPSAVDDVAGRGVQDLGVY